MHGQVRFHNMTLPCFSESVHACATTAPCSCLKALSRCYLSSTCLPYVLDADDKAHMHGHACLCCCFCAQGLLTSYCIEQTCILPSTRASCLLQCTSQCETSLCQSKHALHYSDKASCLLQGLSCQICCGDSVTCSLTMKLCQGSGMYNSE